MTKDECHNGRSEQTKIPENWVLEIEKEISKVSDVERELGKDQLNGKTLIMLNVTYSFGYIYILVSAFEKNLKLKLMILQLFESFSMTYND